MMNNQLDKPIKVLFLPAWYPSRVDMLAGVFTERHAQALKNQINVFVLYVCGDTSLKSQFEYEHAVENDIPVLRAYYKKTKNKTIWQILLNGIRYGIAMIHGYKLVLKAFGRPDINHVHVLTRTAIWPLIMYWIYKTPFVITEHWSRFLPEENSYKGCLRKILTKIAVRNSQGVSTVSNALKKGMEYHGLRHRNFHIIPNVVDTNLFLPSRSTEYGRLFRFVHVSSFETVKNVKGIIDAAILLDQEGNPFVLDLVGGGRCLAEYKSYMSEQAFDVGKINFCGWLYGEKLVEKLQEADVFILFSHYENQPCVVLESFSCSLPVIGTKAGGIPELVNDKTGVLVAPGDVEELKSAMIWMQKNKQSFNKTYLRDLAVENFSYESVAMRYMKFYKESLKLQ